MKHLFFLAVLFLLGFNSQNLSANEDGAYLDPQYKELIHPKKITGKATGLPVRSKTEELIAKQTPVRSQGSRGTCSIFAATALLESLLVIDKDFSNELDLSEEWLEYLIMRETASEGSSSTANFRAYLEWGPTYEELLPYIGMEWESVLTGTLSEERCGHIKSTDKFRLKACLLGHRDPDLLDLSDEDLKEKDKELFLAKKQAEELRDEYVKSKDYSFYVYSEKEVKKSLLRGVPVTLDIDFFYGAWNHRKSVDLGIPRNLEHWNKGIVGYPLKGSVDYINTRKEPAGHAFVIVGYDDALEIELEHLMPNGEIIKKTYKGVYYFKNSWGVGSFGIDFKLSNNNYPGYGMILQDYAHDHGSFYRLRLE